MPKIREWVQTYRPKLFIGSGISYHQEFGQAVFGKKITFNQEKFQMDSNSRVKRILWHQEDDIKLIILQHFSVRGNSHEALKAFGQFGQKFLEA